MQLEANCILDSITFPALYCTHSETDNTLQN